MNDKPITLSKPFLDYSAAFLAAMTAPKPSYSDEHMQRNRSIQRTINSILPSGYRCWVLGSLTVLIYRRKDGKHRCVTQLTISDNRAASIAVNEINCHMAYWAQVTDCGRESGKRGHGPEFVLRLPHGDTPRYDD